MEEMIFKTFIVLLMLLYVVTIAHVLVNRKKLPLKPTFRYILIVVPFIGAIVYFFTLPKG